MQKKTYELFARLCESYIAEASSAMDLIVKHPGGRQVVQNLHQAHNLAHDIAYNPVAGIKWSDLKDNYRGSWVIIQGTDGTAAIKASGGNTGSYTAVTSSGEAPETTTDSRGGNIIDFIKSQVGKPVKYYVGRNTTAVTDKQRKRAEQKKGLTPGEVSQEALVKKFKPLWAKAITAAIADIKGHVTNQIKNDAFEKAKRKLDQIEALQNGLDAVERGSDDVPGFISTAVNSAVLMTASHYYPEQTGSITKSYSRNYSSERSEGPQLLLKDIAGGDQKKLGTVLSFFKRSLISG